MLFRHSNLTVAQFIIGLLFVGLIQAGQNLTGYFKTEAGMEANVLESDSTSRSSLTTPVLANLNYRLITQRLSFNANTTGGCLVYDYSAENKVTLSLMAHADYTISRKIFISSTINTFNKWWLQQRYAYTNSDLRTGLGLNLNRLTPVFSLVLSQNSYRHKSNLDNRQFGGQAEINYQINPGLSFSTQSGFILIDYPHRQVYSTGLSSLDTLSRQKDRFAFGQVGLEWRRRALYGLRLKVINVCSNNEFSEYYGASLSYYLSGKIGRGFYQVIADVLLKKYRSDLSQYFLYYNPDPEQNVQNQLLLGWEWPLWKHLAVTGRAAVMRNETHYSGLYYDKWFFSGGLIYRSD